MRTILATAVLGTALWAAPADAGRGTTTQARALKTKPAGLGKRIANKVDRLLSGKNRLERRGPRVDKSKATLWLGVTVDRQKGD